MRTIEDIAGDALYLLGDDMEEDEFDRVSAMPPEHQVRYFFTCGECDAFAVALHRITGWPVMGVVSQQYGAMHRLVAAPDGRLLDAEGWTDAASLAKRYGVARVRVGALRDGSEGLSSYEEEPGGIDLVADAVAAMRKFDWAPFNTDEFRTLLPDEEACAVPSA